VARDDPSDVAWAMGADQESDRRLRTATQSRLESLHRGQGTIAVLGRNLGEHRLDVAAGAPIELVEGAPAERRQCQQPLPPVGGRRTLGDQPLLAKTLQDAAEVPRIELERGGEVGRRRLLAMRQLVQHADLGETERALEMALAENADLAGVEAIEPPHRFDRRRRRRHRPTVGGRGRLGNRAAACRPPGHAALTCGRDSRRRRRRPCSTRALATASPARW
jgi:hypothetical protein